MKKAFKIIAQILLAGIALIVTAVYLLGYIGESFTVSFYRAPEQDLIYLYEEEDIGYKVLQINADETAQISLIIGSEASSRLATVKYDNRGIKLNHIFSRLYVNPNQPLLNKRFILAQNTYMTAYWCTGKAIGAWPEILLNEEEYNKIAMFLAFDDEKAIVDNDTFYQKPIPGWIKDMIAL